MLVQETTGIPNLFSTLNSCSLRSVALEDNKIDSLDNPKKGKNKPFESLVSKEMCSTPMFAFAPVAATTIVKSIVHIQQGQKIPLLNLIISKFKNLLKTTIVKSIVNVQQGQEVPFLNLVIVE